jgi:hypothetical protein
VSSMACTKGRVAMVFPHPPSWSVSTRPHVPIWTARCSHEGMPTPSSRPPVRPRVPTAPIAAFLPTLGPVRLGALSLTTPPWPGRGRTRASRRSHSVPSGGTCIDAPSSHTHRDTSAMKRARHFPGQRDPECLRPTDARNRGGRNWRCRRAGLGFERSPVDEDGSAREPTPVECRPLRGRFVDLFPTCLRYSSEVSSWVVARGAWETCALVALCGLSWRLPPSCSSPSRQPGPPVRPMRWGTKRCSAFSCGRQGAEPGGFLPARRQDLACG